VLNVLTFNKLLILFFDTFKYDKLEGYREQSNVLGTELFASKYNLSKVVNEGISVIGQDV
jgi:hypothetical protein